MNSGVSGISGGGERRIRSTTVAGDEEEEQLLLLLLLLGESESATTVVQRLRWRLRLIIFHRLLTSFRHFLLLLLLFHLGGNRLVFLVLFLYHVFLLLFFSSSSSSSRDSIVSFGSLGGGDHHHRWELGSAAAVLLLFSLTDLLVADVHFVIAGCWAAFLHLLLLFFDIISSNNIRVLGSLFSASFSSLLIFPCFRWAIWALLLLLLLFHRFCDLSVSVAGQRLVVDDDDRLETFFLLLFFFLLFFNNNFLALKLGHLGVSVTGQLVLVLATTTTTTSSSVIGLGTFFLFLFLLFFNNFLILMMLGHFSFVSVAGIHFIIGGLAFRAFFFSFVLHFFLLFSNLFSLEAIVGSLLHLLLLLYLLWLILSALVTDDHFINDWLRTFVQDFFCLLLFPNNFLALLRWASLVQGADRGAAAVASSRHQQRILLAQGGHLNHRRSLFRRRHEAVQRRRWSSRGRGRLLLLHLLGPNQTKDKGVAAVAEDDAVLVLEGNGVAHQLAVEEDRQVSIVGGARGGAEDLEDDGVGAVVGRGSCCANGIEESTFQRDEVNLQVGLGHLRVVDANVHRVAGADHRPRLGQLVLLSIVQKGGQHLALVGVGVTDADLNN
ncbi:hypothetical protein TYRP_010375 [Tyrophagus putrescentiae]|nr:hypothetical protein TYRP_010375 [Tyrophagus putrescentiae]